MFKPVSSSYVSSGAFKSKLLPQIVGWAMDARLDRIELGSGLRWMPDVLDPVRETAGRKVHYLVHNYFPPHERPFVLNLASTDEAVLARSLDHCRRSMDLTAELHAPFFSVHAGFAFKARPEQLGRDLTQTPRVPLQEAHGIFVRSVRDLCAYAAAKDIKLLIENNVIASFNLVNGENHLGLCATAEDILRTRREVDSPNLGFLIDMGHLNVTATALKFDRHAFLDKVAPHIVAFHLSDNDGMADQNWPFDEKAWFIPRLAEFPNATMILESYSLEIKEIQEVCGVINRARQRRCTV